jgi:hypothetical protein
VPTLRTVNRSYRMPVTVPSEDTVPPAAGLLIAADRPENKNFTKYRNDVGTGINSEVRHTFANGTGRYLLATYDAWGVEANGQDRASDNAETFEGALHTFTETTGSGGAIVTSTAMFAVHFVRIRHFDGTVTELDDRPTSVTIPAGDSADGLIDLGASMPAGTVLIERCYVHVNSGESLTLHQGNGTASFSGALKEVSTISNGETSKVDTPYTRNNGGYPNASTYGRWASSIRHIDAPPASLWHPTLLMGDSLSQGPYGWRMALNQNYHVPHVSIACSGEQAHTFLVNDWRTQYRRKLAALGGFSRATCNWFTNDLVLNNPTQTLAVLQAKLVNLRAQLNAWGVLDAGIIVSTLPANTKSTDGWVTLANQTLVTGGTNTRGKNQQTLLDYNAWLRQGTQVWGYTPAAWLHPSGFYVADVGGAVSTLNSSPTDTPSTIAKWSTPGGQALTQDGLHPGTTLGTNMWAAAVPAEHFRVGA